MIDTTASHLPTNPEAEEKLAQMVARLAREAVGPDAEIQDLDVAGDKLIVTYTLPQAG